MAIPKQIQNLLSDDELLYDFKHTNNQQALAILYLRYSDLLYGVCFKYLKNAESSKDAVMNIYTEIVQKLLSHEVDNFKGWIYVVAKNHCLMQLRKEKKAITVEFQPQFMHNEDFSHLDDILSKEKDLIKLENCISQLNTEQNRVINLFYLQNKCYNEIADEVKMDWNKVRSVIQNGRRNLKICMEENE